MSGGAVMPTADVSLARQGEIRSFMIAEEKRKAAESPSAPQGLSKSSQPPKGSAELLPELVADNEAPTNKLTTPEEGQTQNSSGASNIEKGEALKGKTSVKDKVKNVFDK